MSNQVTTVKIQANAISTYSQLMRACISGMNAAAKLHDDETRRKLDLIFAQAKQEHAKLVEAETVGGNPALG